MRIPEFPKCCFCLPLRGGLLLWAYFRLVSNLLPIATVIDFAIKIDAWEYGLPVIHYAVDFSFTFMFIIGAHRKNPKWITVYMYYVIIAVAVYVVGDFSFILFHYLIPLMEIPVTFRYLADIHISLLVYMEMILVLIEIYFVMLLRSEVNKLKDSQETGRAMFSPPSNDVIAV